MKRHHGHDNFYKDKTFLRWGLQFKGLAHYYGGELGSRQVDIELAIPRSENNRKWTVYRTHGSLIKKKKTSKPASNKATPTSTEPHLLIASPLLGIIFFQTITEDFCLFVYLIIFKTGFYIIKGEVELSM